MSATSWSVPYPCDAGTGLPSGYHNFVAGPSGIIVCTLCGKVPNQ